MATTETTTASETKKARSSFGQVFQRRRKDGSLYPGWWVRYVSGGKRTMRFGGTSKKLAEEYLAARRLERVHDRIRGVPGAQREKVSVFVPAALETFKGTHRPGGMGSLTTSLNLFKNDAALADRDVLEIEPKDIDAFLQRLRLERGYANSTMYTVRAHLSALFTLAIAQGKARANPCKGVKLARRDQKMRPYLEPERLTRIYAAVPAADGLRACAILCGDAGLRRNEAVFLEWRELGPKFATLTISGERAKGHTSRTVPLTQRVRDALAELDAARSAIPFRSDERVFDFTEHRFYEVFHAAMAKIGEDTVTPHVLRHGFASRLVQSGVDVPTVGRILGHQDIKTTMAYAAWAPKSAEREAIRKFEAADQPAAPPAAAAGS